MTFEYLPALIRPIPIKKLRVERDIAYVPLTSGLEAIIDADDAEKVNYRNWVANTAANPVYAFVMLKKTRLHDARSVSMHRYLMGFPEGVVDHINGDTLDNRKSNLRVCSHAENLRNRHRTSINKSGFKGVSRATRGKPWAATIGHNYSTIHLGQFDTAEAAAEAYDVAALQLHGDFAVTNFASPTEVTV